MKKIFICLTITIQGFHFNMFAQWTSSPPYLSSTDYIGIGTATPSAALQIDGNNLTGPTSTGDVFLTDAPNSATYWKMLRGGSEYGRIWNNNDPHFYIQAVNASGDVRLQSGGTNTRMTVSNGGNVGIGTTAPSSLFHVHSGPAQWTNSTTGSSSSDGFLVNINSSTVELNQQESAPLKLLTAGADRLTILGSGNTGYTGIGTTSPTSVFHINGNGTPSTTGEVFRTDAPGSASGPITYWRMFSNGSEKFNVNYSPVTGNIATNIDASAELRISTQTNNAMRFYTNGAQRMHINNGSGNVGFIGMGSGFGDPKSLLHLNAGGTSNVYEQFTNGGTTGNNNSSDGFKIGIDGTTGNAMLNQQESFDMNFLTSATQRMTILSGGNVGINHASPSSKLEISSGTTGVSGLQFSDLTSGFFPGATASRFLTVAPDGKVILRDESGTGTLTSAANGTSISTGTVELGQAVSGSGGQLTSDREIPLNDQNIFFTEPGSPNGSDNGIGIGIGTSIDPTVRLDVSKSTISSPALNISVAGRFISNCTFDDASNDCTGIIGNATGVSDETLANNMVGGKFSAIGSSLFYTSGVEGDATGYQTSVYGGRFNAIGTDVNGGGSTGVSGTATGSQTNIGVFGIVAGSNPSDWAGYFLGDVTYTGTLVPPSDSTIKNNINPLNNISMLLSQLTPHSYNFNPGVYPQLNLPNGLNYGLISQEVENIFPELVKQINVLPLKDSLGNVINPGGTIKGLNYIGLIPLLLQGWKEQQQNIQALQTQLEQLQDINGSSNKQANPGNGIRSSIDVEINSARSIILDQNVPNPFADHTTINYTIPEDVSKAQIIFYTNNGTVIKIVDINEKGEGQLNVFAADLSSGIYTYTLIADGQVVETKKMVKQ